MKKVGFKSIVVSTIFLVMGLQSNIFAKNIVICVDGTGDSNISTEERSTTNVFELSALLIRDENQIVKYFSGVGTTGSKLWDAKGQMTGWGADRIRKDAQKFLSSTYKVDDNIYIFGFSRGAAIARDLVNHIRKPIKVLGLWDTVAAFGIPDDILGFSFQGLNIGKELDIPSNVQQIFHLVSIDEKRTPFTPTLVENALNVEEVWFSGVHSDVGGGYYERKLADITLLYMVKQTTKHGLKFNKILLDAISINEKGEGTIHDTKQKKYPSDRKKSRKIFVRENDKVSSKKPKIHRTVFERMMKHNQTYKPQNVIDLNSSYIIVE